MQGHGGERARAERHLRPYLNVQMVWEPLSAENDPWPALATCGITPDTLTEVVCAELKKPIVAVP